METMSYSAFRSDLASAIDRVNEDHVPIVITRKSSTSGVLVSLDDWRSIQETLYLLSNPANASRLLSSVERVKSGDVIQRDLIDVED